MQRLYKYSTCCQRTALHFWTFAAVAFGSDKHADPACPSHPRQETCYNIMLVKEASGYAPHPGGPALLWQRGGVGDIFLLNQLQGGGTAITMTGAHLRTSVQSHFHQEQSDQSWCSKQRLEHACMTVCSLLKPPPAM